MISDSINALCRLCTKTTCTKHPEYGRPMSEEGAKPGPVVGGYVTVAGDLGAGRSYSTLFALVRPDEWERVNRRAKEAEAERDRLREKLKKAEAALQWIEEDALADLLGREKPKLASP